MDAAANGKKPSASGKAKNEMKSILESFNKIAAPKMEECGAMPMGGPEPDRGNPVTMNVSINASGKDHVQDLIDMMKLAGAVDAKAVDHDDMPMIKQLPAPAEHDHDMNDMATLMRIAGDSDEEAETDENLVVQATGLDPEDEEDDEDDMEEEWDNAPDEEYRDHEYMTKDLAGGLNKSKKSYKPTAGGDNPMALEDQIRKDLRAALEEKFSKKKI